MPPLRCAPSNARASWLWAALAVAALLAWQFLTVHYNYSGNWTALFCTGGKLRVPPQLAAGTYRFPNSDGYDGQMYRYVAHDPLFQRGFAGYVDAPVLRARRILVPGLAYLVAGGREEFIDAAYIAVIALFVWLGSYWLSRLACLSGRHTAWGVAFLFVPATLISMDRMTVDVAPAALTAGFAYFIKTEALAKLYLVLALACLARETGVLLLAAWLLCYLWRKQFRKALLWATAVAPALAWYLFVHTHARAAARLGVPRWVFQGLGLGILRRIADPARYPFAAALETLVRSFDVIALAGMLGALVAALVLLRARPLSPVRILAALYVALALVVDNTRFWANCYSYGRPFSPLLVLLAMQALARPQWHKDWWWCLLPTVLMDLRIGLQLGPQVLGILRGL